MSVISGNSITQADMDNLASLANSTLLPIVNAAVLTNSWSMHEYDFDYSNPTKQTQPAYEFPTYPNNTTPASNVQGTIVYNTGSYLAYSSSLYIRVYPYKVVSGKRQYCLVPTQGIVTSDSSNNNYIVNWNWDAPAGGADGYIVEKYIFPYVNNGLKTYIDVSNNAYSDASWPQPYTQHNPMSWNTTLNRIKADYHNLMHNIGLGADYLFNSDSNILSGPWCVGVNDPDVFPIENGPGYLDTDVYTVFYYYPIFPMLNLSGQGELYGSLGGMSYLGSSNSFTCYKNVKFVYSLNDALDGLTLSQGRRVDVGWGTLANMAELDYSASVAGNWTGVAWWLLNGPTNGPAPLVSSFGTVSATPSTGITWTTVASTNHTQYALVAHISKSVGTNEAGILQFTASGAPAGYSFAGGPFTTHRLIYSSNAQSVPIEAIHPTSTCMLINSQDMPSGNSDFIVNNVYGGAFWQISDPTVKGCWLANSLPVGGNNVFIDQDLPNYVGQVYGDLFHSTPIAVSENIPYVVNEPIITIGTQSYNMVDNPPDYSYDNNSPIYASSMRQQALLQEGTVQFTLYISGSQVFTSSVSGSTPYIHDTGLPRYNLIRQSMQPQPAQWLVMNTGSQMPLTWGTWGNPNQNLGLYTGQVLSSGSQAYYSISVPGNVTSVKINLRQSSSLNGGVKIYDGGPLPSNLTMSIYVSNTGFPNPSDPSTYNFKTTNKQVRIPNNGGVGYLDTIRNGGFNYAIQNNNTDSVYFDILTEIDTGVVPRELSFNPTTHECFSNVIADIPPGFTQFYTFPSNYPTFVGLKPVPQQGYVIFKIRATRLPVINSSGISITPSSGPQINVAIGQNKLQYDGTWQFAPFYSDNSSIGAGGSGQGAGESGGSEGAGGSGRPYTITIPSGSRDTGDIEVFWAVAHGNSLVWQSDTPVILEAWANWQPIWQNTRYGFISYYINMDINYLTNFAPMGYQFCNSFINFFFYPQANYGDIGFGEDVYGGSAATAVQFPMAKFQYDEITACLNNI